MDYIEENEILVVRWKFTSIYKTAAARINVEGRQINYVQQKLETLTKIECSVNYYLSASIARFNWRGETVLGGSGGSNELASRPNVVSLLDIEEKIPPKNTRKRQPLERKFYNVNNFVDLSVDDDISFRGGGLSEKENAQQNRTKSVDCIKSLASVAGRAKVTATRQPTFRDGGKFHYLLLCGKFLLSYSWRCKWQKRSCSSYKAVLHIWRRL